MKRIFLRKFYNFYELKKRRKPIGKICYVVVSLRERRLEKGSVSPMNGERKKGIGKDSGKQDTGGETRTICMYGARKGFVYSHSGDNGRKDPPVPIPNTEVKLSRAESTCRDTDREDRSSPLFNSDGLSGLLTDRLFLALLVYWGETRIYVAILCRACVFACSFTSK